MQALLQHADADGDGSINYREFLAAAMDMQNVSREMALRAAFVEFDTDGSGTLSPDEVIQVGLGWHATHGQNVVLMLVYCAPLCCAACTRHGGASGGS